MAGLHKANLLLEGAEPSPCGAWARLVGKPLSGELVGEHCWTYSDLLLEGGTAWPLLSRGEACHEPLSRGLVGGGRRGAGRTHGMLRSTSALLRPVTQTRPQVVQLLPSPHPFTPHCVKTCKAHTVYKDVS